MIADGVLRWRRIRLSLTLWCSKAPVLPPSYREPQKSTVSLQFRHFGHSVVDTILSVAKAQGYNSMAFRR